MMPVSFERVRSIEDLEQDVIAGMRQEKAALLQVEQTKVALETIKRAVTTADEQWAVARERLYSAQQALLATLALSARD